MDSSRHALYAIAEATYGTTPATPAFKKIRHTGTTLALAKGLMVSEEIRDDRQISDARHGTKQTGGDISGELTYGTYDEFMEAVLGGTWAAKFAPFVATTISAAASDNSINDSGAGFPAWEVGDKVTISGFTGTAGNNQAGVVVSRTASKVVLTTATPLVDDAAGESVTVTSNTQKLIAGTTRRSFSILRHFSDQVTGGDKPYHLYVGQEFNTLNLTMGVEALVGIVFGILGKSQSATSDTAPADSTFVAVNTNKTFDTFTGTLTEGGSALAVATELNLTLENGLTPRFVVGSDATRKPTIGRSNLTGQMTAFAENSSLLDKFINGTESSLKVLLPDAHGNKYRVTLPRILYTGGQVDVSGQGPTTIPLPFQALLDSTTGTNIIIERIPV